MANVDLIFEEYPFLGNYIKRKYVNEAHVGRWTDSFLKTQRSATRFYARLYLLDKEGKTVTEIDGNLLRWFFNGDETIERALARIGPERARRITQAFYIQPDALGATVKLLKTPQEHANAAEWHRAIIEKERAAFEAERL